MGLLDFLGQLTQAGLNKRAQIRQNDFNASQADLNRQFQAQEAQIARDWQEQQYNQYSSPQAMVRQYQDAGLNPALMYGQNLQSSTGSSPMPSGSSASGSALGVSGATGNIVESIGSLARLKSEIDNIKADTDSKKADALLKGSTVALNQSVQNLNSKQMSKIDSEIALMKEQANTERSKQEATVIENAIKLSQKKQIDMKNAISSEFEKTFGFQADSDTIGLLLLSSSNLIQSVVGGGFGLLNKLLPQKSLKLPSKK